MGKKILRPKCQHFNIPILIFKEVLLLAIFIITGHFADSRAILGILKLIFLMHLTIC